MEGFLILINPFGKLFFGIFFDSEPTSMTMPVDNMFGNKNQ